MLFENEHCVCLQYNNNAVKGILRKLFGFGIKLAKKPIVKVCQIGNLYRLNTG